MRRPSPSPARTLRVATITSTLLVSLMIACVAAVASRLANIFTPGWPTGYWVGASLFISLEAQYAQRMRYRPTAQNRWAYTLSELVFLALGMRVLLYLVHGPAQLLADLADWQGFFIRLFTGEYLLLLGVTLGVWLLGNLFAADLAELQDFSNSISWDYFGHLQKSREDTHARLIGRVFTVGMFLALMAMLLRLDMIQQVLGPGAGAGILPLVMIYFALGLVLLSLDHHELLRLGWIYDKTPIAARMTRNWLVYGAVFFSLLAVVALLLPARYSLGLLDVLAVIIGWLIQIGFFLFLLITTPFLYLFGLLFQLLGIREASPTTLPKFEPPPAPAGSAPAPWWEVLRSVLFWIVFLGIAGYAIGQYVEHNQELLDSLRRSPLAIWWRALLGWLARTGQKISQRAKASLARLDRSVNQTRAIPNLRLPGLRRYTPRQQIILLFNHLIQTAETRRLGREQSQTPREYVELLKEELADANAELDRLGQDFIEARYTRHPIAPEQAKESQRLWERIRDALLRRPQE